jgi:hypothetical protein
MYEYVSLLLLLLWNPNLTLIAVPGLAQDYLSSDVFDGDIHINIYKMTIHKMLENRCEVFCTLGITGILDFVHCPVF